jgi:hypothetical protein
MRMPESNLPAVSDTLLKRISRYTKRVSSVGFTGDYVVIYFKTFPKSKPKYLRMDVAQEISDALGMEYSFMREDEESCAWVFRRSL